MKKQDKRNWPKAVIQILSFLLIPGLFEAQFSAVGTIISAVYQGTVFLRIFLQLRGCAGFSVVCRK